MWTITIEGEGAPAYAYTTYKALEAGVRVLRAQGLTLLIGFDTRGRYAATIQPGESQGRASRSGTRQAPNTGQENERTRRTRAST